MAKTLKGSGAFPCLHIDMSGYKFNREEANTSGYIQPLSRGPFLMPESEVTACLIFFTLKNASETHAT
jgi:hypothetical protein